MMPVFVIPTLLTAILVFIFGFVVGQSWDLGWQLPIGVTLAAFIATLSLITTVHHSYAIRRHNELQVKPHLVFDSYFDSTMKEGFHTYRLSIKNVGLGPAIISSYLVTLGSIEIKDSDAVFVEFLKLVNKKTPASGRAHVEAKYLSDGEALDKGAEKILFQSGIPADGRTFMQGREIVQKLAEEIQLSVIYKCHYGNQFEIARKKTNTSQETPDN